MMITPRNNMFFLVLCTLLFGLVMSQNNGCVYVYGNWSVCFDSVQNRTISCVCGGAVTTISSCTKVLALPDPLERDCQIEDDTTNCFWKWSVWSQCTADCGGGNSSRTHQCQCDGVVSENQLCEPTYNLGSELVACNDFKCGETPALNKQYWMEQDEEGHWPITNGVFNCSAGYNATDSPKGKTWSYVLIQNPLSHSNPQWYYLAREYIASELNIANGAQFSPEAISLVKGVGVILQNCAGWNANEIPLIYGCKEKLGRLNNNIGGLENVDEQVAVLSNGGRNNRSGDSMSRLTFLLVITVPAAAVVIVVVIIALSIYYIREKKTVAQDEFESEDEEEPLQNPNNAVSLDTLPNTAAFGEPQIPLELVPQHGESTSEEQ